MSRHKKPGPVARLRKCLGSVPHLFGKAVVVWCVLFGTGCSVYALIILHRTGYDASALLGVILAFFGGELLILCLKKILAEKPKGEKTNENRLEEETDEP